MNQPGRLHALDNLRATMMWLGIVLHVAVNHLAGESPLPWRDDRTTRVADLIVVFIHTFRMPVFFILAGFFVAMLVERRGYAGMLRHRVARLGVPFALFWPPVFVVMVLLGLLFVHRMAYGTFGIDERLVPALPGHPRINTMHLWFLYLLLWFSVLTAACGFAARALAWRPWTRPSALLRVAGARWWGALVLALPCAWAGSFYPLGIVMPNSSFAPPWMEWLHNGAFYVFGLVLYLHRDELLERMRRRRTAFAAAGLVFFLASGTLVNMPGRAALLWSPLAIAYLYNVASWLWSFSLIGWFLHRLSQPNRLMRYLSQSSYWVYLVHMIGTIGFGALLYEAPLPAMAKIVLNIALTSFVCLLSYQVFVRGRWIGRLLNGTRG